MDDKEVLSAIIILIMGAVAAGIYIYSNAPDWVHSPIATLIIIVVLGFLGRRLYGWFKNSEQDEYKRRKQQEQRQFNAQQRHRQEEQQQYEYEQYYRQEPQSQTDDGGDNPFEILGVSETTSETEVKNAWRRLSKEWHPDTFAEKGEEVKRVASERFDAVQKAYEQIKRLKGWK